MPEREPNYSELKDFKENPYDGFFIAIEGLDGSGVTGQAKNIDENLKLSGIKTLLTKEPTDQFIGGFLRSVLRGNLVFSQEAIQMLFAADRAWHINSDIAPVLKNNGVVVTDRYFWSSFAFGLLTHDQDFLFTINKIFPLPDCTIFLDVPPKVCIERIASDRFHFELFDDEERFEKVYQNYQWLGRNFSQYIKTVDGTQPTRQVTTDIMKIIKQHPKFLPPIMGIEDSLKK